MSWRGWGRERVWLSRVTSAQPAYNQRDDNDTQQLPGPLPTFATAVVRRSKGARCAKRNFDWDLLSLTPALLERYILLQQNVSYSHSLVGTIDRGELAERRHTVLGCPVALGLPLHAVRLPASSGAYGNPEARVLRRRGSAPANPRFKRADERFARTAALCVWA